MQFGGRVPAFRKKLHRPCRRKAAALDGKLRWDSRKQRSRRLASRVSAQWRQASSPLTFRKKPPAVVPQKVGRVGRGANPGDNRRPACPPFPRSAL